MAVSSAWRISALSRGHCRQRRADSSTTSSLIRPPAVPAPPASFFTGDVGRTLRRLPNRADLVVLDPPRTGAGKAVMAAVARLLTEGPLKILNTARRVAA